jgi:hypothetical protein
VLTVFVVDWLRALRKAHGEIQRRLLLTKSLIDQRILGVDGLLKSDGPVSANIAGKCSSKASDPCNGVGSCPAGY